MHKYCGCFKCHKNVNLVPRLIALSEICCPWENGGSRCFPFNPIGKEADQKSWREFKRFFHPEAFLTPKKGLEYFQSKIYYSAMKAVVVYEAHYILRGVSFDFWGEGGSNKVEDLDNARTFFRPDEQARFFFPVEVQR